MTPAETQYFALLRAALWGTPLPVNMKIDWKSVMQLAEYHGNIVLLSDVAAQMSDDNEPSSEMLDRMQRVMRSNLLHQMRLRQILIPAVQLRYREATIGARRWTQEGTTTSSSASIPWRYIVLVPMWKMQKTVPYMPALSVKDSRSTYNTLALTDSISLSLPRNSQCSSLSSMLGTIS